MNVACMFCPEPAVTRDSNVPRCMLHTAAHGERRADRLWCGRVIPHVCERNRWARRMRRLFA